MPMVCSECGCECDALRANRLRKLSIMASFASDSRRRGSRHGSGYETPDHTSI